MISLDIQKYQKELADFLSIGKRWLFVPGFVYTTNEAKNVFARMVMQGLEAEEAVDPLMQMDKLEDLLKLKTVKVLRIAVKSGFLMVDNPNMQTQRQINRVEKPEDVEKLRSYDAACRSLEKAGKEVDGFPVCEFDIGGDLLSDALDSVGSPKEPILLETGNSFRITSESNQMVTMPKVKAEQQIGIKLSMEAQTHLRKAIGDMTRIKMTGRGPFCIFKNPRLTVMAGGMVKQ